MGRRLVACMGSSLWLVLGFVSPVHAQSDSQLGFSPTPTDIVAYADYPTTRQHFVVGTAFGTGWAFRCSTGQLPERIGVSVYQEVLTFIPGIDPVTGAFTETVALGWSSTPLAIGYAVSHGPRPDVTLAFEGECPALAIGADVGWGVTFLTALPVGHYRMDIWFVDPVGNVSTISKEIYVDPAPAPTPNCAPTGALLAPARSTAIDGDPQPTQKGRERR